MRILYSHYLPTDDHPAARMVETVAAELRRLGHDVRVHRSHPPEPVAPGPKTQAPPPGFARRALWFARAIGRNRAAVRRDAAALADYRPDVVLCRQDAYCFSMPLAARRGGVPLVTYADAPVAYESRHFNPHRRWHPPGLVEAIERWGLRRSRAVVTVSTPAARLLDRYRLGVPVTVAPNGVDTDRFHPLPPADRKVVRDQLGLTTPHVAGFVGTFRPFHGLPLLRDLIRSTAGRTDLTWLLVGDGPGRPGLEAELAGLPNVRFTGRRPQDDIPRLLAAMDVLVVPHQRVVPEFYFCPLKVLEGMAAGVACVASPQGDVPKLLDGGRAGRLVPTDDPADWAAAVSALLDTPAHRAELAAAARRRAEGQYTWAHTARRVSAAITEAVGPVPEGANLGETWTTTRSTGGVRC